MKPNTTNSSKRTSQSTSKGRQRSRAKQSILCANEQFPSHRMSAAASSNSLSLIEMVSQNLLSQQQAIMKRREQILFKEMYQKALDRGVINFSSIEDTQVMITAMKKKVRSVKEKDFIQSAIKQIGVFANHPKIFQQESAKTHLFREIKHTHFEQRDVIFKQGDIGDTYYMIMKGEVFCLVPTSKNQEKGQEVPESTKKKKRGATLQAQEPEKPKEPVVAYEKMLDLNDNEFLEKAFPNFKNVKTFKAWEGFGDIALITQQYRTATMVCKDECDVICLTKSGFDKIVGELARLVRITQVKFLKQFPFFSSIPKSKLMSILMDIEVMTFAKDKVLFEEGQPITQVFFVLEGEVEISKKLCVEKQEKNIMNAMEKQFQRENSMNRSLLHRNTGATMRTICLSIIGPNSYCGIDDLFNGKNIRHTTAKCISPTSVIYVLSKEKFQDSLRVYKQMERDNSSCVEKDKLMEQRSDEIAQCIQSTVNNQLRQKQESIDKPEKPMQPFMKPRDIIKHRIILSKEMMENPIFQHGYRVFVNSQQEQQLQKSNSLNESKLMNKFDISNDEVIGDDDYKSGVRSRADSAGLNYNDNSSMNLSHTSSPFKTFNSQQIDRQRDCSSNKTVQQSKLQSRPESSSIEKKIDFFESMNLHRIKRDCPFLKNNSILKGILQSSPKVKQNLSQQSFSRLNSETKMMRLINQSMKTAPNCSGTQSPANSSNRVFSPSTDFPSNGSPQSQHSKFFFNETTRSSSSVFSEFARIKYQNDMKNQMHSMKSSVENCKNSNAKNNSSCSFNGSESFTGIQSPIGVKSVYNRRSKTSANFFETLLQKKTSLDKRNQEDHSKIMSNQSFTLNKPVGPVSLNPGFFYPKASNESFSSIDKFLKSRLMANDRMRQKTTACTTEPMQATITIPSFNLNETDGSQSGKDLLNSEKQISLPTEQDMQSPLLSYPAPPLIKKRIELPYRKAGYLIANPLVL